MNSSVVAMIDHALLHPTLTDQELRAGCELARRLSVATVCVKPYHVELAAKLLAGCTVGVCTVIGFPHGATRSRGKVAETQDVCQAGATEVDLVVNIGQVLSQNWDAVTDDIAAVVAEARRHEALTKVIIETDYVSADADKIRLCEICGRAGAAFIKTSTGFAYTRDEQGHWITRGATEHDVRLLKAHCQGGLQVKASGGIRSYADAMRMVSCGATRLGTSASAAIAAGAATDQVAY